VLAIPSAAIPEVAQRFGAQLSGRVVIDPSVRFSPGGSPIMNRFEELSGVGVRYVRAFSTQGPEVLAVPVIEGQAADQFFTAADGDSKDRAQELITAVGLRPVYIGGHDRIHVVDGVTRLWFALAIKQERGRHLSFRLLNE
jgi:8-hydroxy-5-deazaflavin:NADPH oxidoreductase